LEGGYGLPELDYKLYETYHFDKIFEFMRENNAQVVLFSKGDET
jgi:hypothetical protein